ncbi:MAG: hypothetical protein HQL51_09375 [Magnetococcales bacterium]|nr:hypothetical protein [Magnetococcales bacterium]
MNLLHSTRLRPLLAAALLAALFLTPPAQARASVLENGFIAALFGFFTLGVFTANTIEESQQPTAVFPAYYPTAFVPGPVQSKAAVYSSVPPYRPGTTARYGVEVPAHQYAGDAPTHQVYVR